MTEIGKKLAAILLAVLMVFGMLFTNVGPVYADANVGSDEEPETIQISSAEDWETFCAKIIEADGAPVNGELTCDVTLTEESSMAGSTAEIPFTGVFDGKGYTLTVNYVNDGRTAPFKHVGGGALIQNLHTAGNITLTTSSDKVRHSSGMVGGVEGIATIRGCTSSVNIRFASGSYSMYAGGFIGHAGYCENLTIEDCIFDGSFDYVDDASSKPGLNYISGFVAWGDNFKLTIKNCVNKGSVSNVRSYYPIAYTYGSHTVENCLYYYPGMKCYGPGTKAVAVSGKDSVEVEVTDKPALTVAGVDYYTSPINVNLTPAIASGTEFWKYTINTGTLSNIETMEGLHQITGFDENIVIGRKVKNIEKTIIIHNTDEWEDLCQLVNHAGGETSFDVELAEDISLDENSTLLGHDWENPFVGTFDGKGHTMHLQLVGDEPFSRVEDAVIKNVNSYGTVSNAYSDNRAYHRSGLVGGCAGTVEIVNCNVDVDLLFLSGTSKVYSGGIVSHGGSASIKMEGCTFTGSFGYVEGAASKPGLQNVGGLIGWGDSMRIEMSNCRNLGTFTDVAQLSPLVRGGTYSLSVEDSYYIGTTIPNNGEYPHDNGIVMITVTSDEGVLLTINDEPFYKAGGVDYYVAPVSVTLKPVLPEGTELEKYIVNDGEISDPSIAEGMHELTGCKKPITISRTVRSTKPDYLISDTDDWAAFCEAVNAGTDDVVLWAVLTQDVTLAPDSPTAGTTQHPFTGIFDGQRYTLTVNYESADKRAPFQNVSGGAIIKNLHTAGAITMTGNTSESWHVSGLIGSTPGEVTIQDCTSSVNLRFPSGASKIYAAGFIGHSNSSTVTMDGCVFDGNIGYVDGAEEKPGLENVAGLIAWGESDSHITMTNCINVGTFEDVISLCPMLRNWGRVDTTDCYYLYTGIPLGDERVRTNGDLMAEIKGADDLLVAGDPVCSYNGKYYYSEKSELTFLFSEEHEDAFTGYTVSSGTISSPDTLEGMHTIKSFTEQAVTVQAHWGDPVEVTIIAGVYDMTNDVCGQGGTYTFNDEDMTHTIDKHTVEQGSSVHLVAVPANGYEFVGWFEGRIVEGTDELQIEPVGEIGSTEPSGQFNANENVVLCAVFKESNVNPPDDWTLYADAKSDKGTIYHDGDTVEIPAGESLFLEFLTDFDRNPSHGASPVIGFSDGYDEGTLTKAGFTVTTGTGTSLGYETDSFGLKIDTTGLESGKEEILYYYVYKDADPVDFINTPHVLDCSLTIRVVASAPAESYTVTFVDGLGNTLKTETVEKGSAATAPEDPTREGYTFDGWDKDFRTVTSDLTVTAKWKENSAPPTPTEPISIKDAEVVLSKTAFTYNAKVQKPIIRTINGFTLNAGTDYTASWSNASSRNVGTYTVTITGEGNYTGTTKGTYTINKAANPLKISPKTATVKYSKLKKKNQTLAVNKVIKFTKDAKDKKTYTLSSAKKDSKSFKKYFKINKTTGKVTIKKDLKKGIYKIRVKVKALGNSNYMASAWKIITFTIKVK